jgi:hypothetical protein
VRSSRIVIGFRNEKSLRLACRRRRIAWASASAHDDNLNHTGGNAFLPAARRANTDEIVFMLLVERTLILDIRFTGFEDHAEVLLVDIRLIVPNRILRVFEILRREPIGKRQCYESPCAVFFVPAFGVAQIVRHRRIEAMAMKAAMSSLTALATSLPMASTTKFKTSPVSTSCVITWSNGALISVLIICIPIAWCLLLWRQLHRVWGGAMLQLPYRNLPTLLVIQGELCGILNGGGLIYG